MKDTRKERNGYVGYRRVCTSAYLFDHMTEGVTRYHTPEGLRQGQPLPWDLHGLTGFAQCDST